MASSQLAPNPFFELTMQFRKNNLPSFDYMHEELFLKIRAKYVVLKKGALILSVIPSMYSLERMLKEAGRKKITVVALCSYLELNPAYCKNNIYSKVDLNDREWSLVHVAASDYDAAFPLTPKLVLFVLHQMLEAEKAEELVVLHGGFRGTKAGSPEKKERNTIVVLVVHEVICNQKVIQKGQIPSDADILKWITNAIATIRKKILTSDFYAPFEEDKNISSEAQVKCCKDAIALYCAHNMDLASACQLSIAPLLKKWADSDSFQSFMICLSYFIHQKKISEDTVNVFFKQFYLNFDEASRIFREECIPDFNACAKNPLDAQKGFKTKYGKHSLGRLLCELYYEKDDFRMSLVQFVQGLLNYKKSGEFDSGGYFFNTMTNLNEYLNVWESCQKEMQSFILSSENELSQDEKKSIQFGFSEHEKLFLLNQFVSSASYFFQKIYFEPPLDDNKKENFKKLFTQRGSPFWAALSSFDADIQSRYIQSYFILFFLSEINDDLSRSMQDELLNVFIKKALQTEESRALNKKIVVSFLLEMRDAGRFYYRKNSTSLISETVSDIQSCMILFKQLWRLNAGFSPLQEYIFEGIVQRIVDSDPPSGDKPYELFDVKQYTAPVNGIPLFFAHPSNARLLEHPKFREIVKVVLDSCKNDPERQDALKKIVQLSMKKEDVNLTHQSGMFVDIHAERKKCLLDADFLQNVWDSIYGNVGIVLQKS